MINHLKPSAKFLIAIVFLSSFPLPVSADPRNPYVQQTIAAFDSGDLPKLKQNLDLQAAAAVRDLRTIDSSRIIAVASCREFANYFGAIPTPTPEQKETLTWLASQPRLMPTLMSAVSDRDPPQRVLELLQTLGAGQNKKLDEFPDLATALIVVWDKPFPNDDTHHQPKFPPDHIARLFDHFTNPRSPIRFNLQQLCWQLDVYIVDLKISDDEIQWANSRYANNFSIASLYFDVNYDDRAFYEGDAKKIAGHDYTLQNLLQYGGVCVEQAYFAEEVAKSMGIPACMCESRGGGAGQAAHAWLGLVNFTNQQYAWDFDQGRYQEDLFWSADIVDPQTHETLTDADVALLGALQKVNGNTRLLSALLLKLADLLPPARRFEIATREIEVSPGNRPAWVTLADMGAKNQLTAPQSQILSGEINRYLLQSYPDFACQTLMQMASGQPETAQVTALDKVARLFPTRPDLRARVRLRQADLLMANRRDEEAFRELNDVLTNDLNAGAIILQALHRADKLMRAHNNLIGLAQVYAQTWPRMPAPERSSYVFWTPYYLVGKTYLKLLDSLGNHMASEDVRNRLTAIIPEGAALR